MEVNVHAVDVDNLNEKQCREIQGVWSMSVCNPSVSQTRGLGRHFLIMLIDSGSEEHVISLADWKRLGKPSLNPSHVRLHSATSDVVGVTGSTILAKMITNLFVFFSLEAFFLPIR